MLVLGGKEDEVDGGDEKKHGEVVVPVEGETVEGYQAEDYEDYERDYLLHHLELHERIRATVALETHAVGRHLKTILQQGDAPRKQNDYIERPVGRKAGRLQFKMAIPGEGHEHIGYDQKDDGEHRRIDSCKHFFQYN